MFIFQFNLKYAQEFNENLDYNEETPFGKFQDDDENKIDEDKSNSREKRKTNIDKELSKSDSMFNKKLDKINSNGDEELFNTKNDQNKIDLPEKKPMTPDISESNPNTPPVKVPAPPEPNGIPMNCITDYKQYCKGKFVNFKFSDGCHKCKCVSSGSKYCKTGPCQYLVKSFKEAPFYCNDVNKKNEENYRKQLKLRKQQKPIRKTEKNKVIRRKMDKIKSKINSLLKNRNNLNKMHINNNKNTDKGNQDISKVIKRNLGKVKGILNSKDNFVLKNKNEKNANKFLGNNKNNKDYHEISKIISKPNHEISQLELEKQKSENPRDHKDLKEISRVLSKKHSKNDDIVKFEHKVKDTLSKMDTFENKIKNEVVDKIEKALNRKNSDNIDENLPKSKFISLSHEKLNTDDNEETDLNKINKNLTKSKSNRESYENFNKNPTKIDKSLSKLTGKHLLRNCIYRIAYNELTIRRIEKKMRIDRGPENFKRDFVHRLIQLKTKNLELKNKILGIVRSQRHLRKIKGIVNANYKSKVGLKNPLVQEDLKTTLGKLEKINTELHKMKAGPKMWHKMVPTHRRRYRRHRRYRRSSSIVGVSRLLLIIIPVIINFAY